MAAGVYAYIEGRMNEGLRLFNEEKAKRQKQIKTSVMSEKKNKTLEGFKSTPLVVY